MCFHIRTWVQATIWSTVCIQGYTEHCVSWLRCIFLFNALDKASFLFTNMKKTWLSYLTIKSIILKDMLTSHLRICYGFPFLHIAIFIWLCTEECLSLIFIGKAYSVNWLISNAEQGYEAIFCHFKNNWGHSWKY